MIRVNNFFSYSLSLILFSVFVFGGSIQYFLGVSSTLYTIFVTFLIYALIFFDIILSKRILVSKFFFLCLLYLFIIVISGIYNKKSVAKVILYFIFPLIPLGTSYMYEVLKKRNISIINTLDTFFRFVILIQLPIILIQKYGFEYLIKLNNSSQFINEYDFMFGSFFIRADHSLGFFLLMYILNLIFRLRKKELKKIPWFLLIYISVTILIMESNLTKLMLMLVFLYYIFLWLYKKINFFGIFVIFVLGLIVFNLALKFPVISGHYTYFKTKYTSDQSEAAFDKGYAKRPQILITYIYRKPIKVIGHGPYDYFNIFKGKFKQTLHFSQLIWTYNDLGLLGLVTVVLMAFFLLKSLSLSRESFLLIFAIFSMYLFMTTVYMDLGMMLSLVLLRRGNKSKA